MSRAPAVILGPDGNPTSLRPAPRRPAVFDPSPHRNRGMIPAPEMSPGLLNRVIATAVAFGMPRGEAEEARTNPFVRTHVAMLAVMVWEAEAGDVQARAVLDRIRFAFGHRQDVAEIIDAQEQPANPVELQQLLGGD